MNVQDFETDLYKKSGGKYFRLLLSTLAKKIRMASGLTLEAAFSALGLKVDGNTAEIAQAKGQLSTHMADLDAHGLASVKSGLAVTRDAVISAQELANAAEDAAQANAAVIETLVQKVAALEKALANSGYNSEEYITETGDWTAPVTAWYEITLIDGGAGAWTDTNGTLYGGLSGATSKFLRFYEKGESVNVTIGAKGIAGENTWETNVLGGRTSFGDLQTNIHERFYGFAVNISLTNQIAIGGGKGNGYKTAPSTYYGAGGGGLIYGSIKTLGDGYPGCVILRWNDPAKANGPLETEVEGEES